LAGGGEARSGSSVHRVNGVSAVVP
jgi:hypothetical protein